MSAVGVRSSGTHSCFYFHGFRPQVSVCLQAHLPCSSQKPFMMLTVKLKLESVYLRGIGITGVKIKRIVASKIERSRSAAGAKQGNVCHHVVSVARGHTCTTDKEPEISGVSCVYNIEIAFGGGQGI